MTEPRHRRFRRETRADQRGFALLLIFLMAALVALMLYRQIPRVAFETERDKEQLLIDRGDQYKRAVQLYYTQFRRYPSKIEDLENTNDKRFLRRRYVDPYTGKDDWRIVHTNGLYLTDSKVQAPPAQAAQNGQAGAGSTGPGSTGPGSTGPGSSSPGGSSSSLSLGPAANSNGAAANASGGGANAGVNATVLSRPSDRTLPSNQSFPSNTPAGAGNLPPITYTGNNQNLSNYSDPASFPPMSLFPNGYNAPPQAGLNVPGLPTNNQTGANQNGLNPNGLNQLGQLNQAGATQPARAQNGLNQVGVNPINQLGLNQPGQPISIPLSQGNGQGGFVPPDLNIQSNLQQGANPLGVQGNPAQPNLVQPNQVQQSLADQGLIPPGQTNPVNSFPGQQNQSPGQLNPNFANQFPQNNDPAQTNPAQQPNFNPGGFNAAGPLPGAQNPALGMITNILGTPHPPPAGLGLDQPGNNQTVGGGIAGVASSYVGPAIKSYGGRTDYSEWEFVFQPQQLAGAPGTAPGTRPGATTPGATSPGTTGTSPFNSGSLGLGGTGK